MRHAVWLPEVLGHRRRAEVSSVSSSILWVTSSDLPGTSPRLPNDCFPPAEGRRGLRYHGNGYPHIPRGWLAVSQAPSRGRRGASRLPRVLNPCHRDSVWCPPTQCPPSWVLLPTPGSVDHATQSMSGVDGDAPQLTAMELEGGCGSVWSRGPTGSSGDPGSSGVWQAVLSQPLL